MNNISIKLFFKIVYLQSVFKNIIRAPGHGSVVPLLKPYIPPGTTIQFFNQIRPSEGSKWNHINPVPHRITLKTFHLNIFPIASKSL